jgi:hypothetical protein
VSTKETVYVVWKPTILLTKRFKESKSVFTERWFTNWSNTCNPSKWSCENSTIKSDSLKDAVFHGDENRELNILLLKTQID